MEGITYRNIYKWYMTVLDIFVLIVTTRLQEKDVLRIHMESIHDDSKYSCSHCDHQAAHKESKHP